MNRYKLKNHILLAKTLLEMFWQLVVFCRTSILYIILLSPSTVNLFHNNNQENLHYSFDNHVHCSRNSEQRSFAGVCALACVFACASCCADAGGDGVRHLPSIRSAMLVRLMFYPFHYQDKPKPGPISSQRINKTREIM